MARRELMQGVGLLALTVTLSGMPGCGKSRLPGDPFSGADWLIVGDPI